MRHRLVIDNEAAAFKSKTGLFEFTPSGKPQLFGLNPRKILWTGRPANSCRMFIGFNVGQTPRWSVDILAELVQKVRSEQKSDKGRRVPPDASFVIQKGLYRSKKTRAVVYEDSVQLIVLSLFGESDKRFRDNMVKLSGIIARELEQDEVIVEFQQEGVPHDAMGVTWASKGAAKP